MFFDPGPYLVPHAVLTVCSHCEFRTQIRTVGPVVVKALVVG